MEKTNTTKKIIMYSIYFPDILVHETYNLRYFMHITFDYMKYHPHKLAKRKEPKKKCVTRNILTMSTETPETNIK